MFSLTANTLCEVFRIYDADYPEYTRIIGQTDQFIISENILEDNEHMGIVVYNKNSIWKVRYESNHIKKLFSNTKPFLDIDIPSNAELSTIITILNERFDCLTFYCEELSTESHFIGKVLLIKDNIIKIQELRPINTDEITVLEFRLDMITRVDAGGDYEVKLINHYSDKIAKIDI
jgi:hypothetical protein